jgi:hypothetical protein
LRAPARTVMIVLMDGLQKFTDKPKQQGGRKSGTTYEALTPLQQEFVDFKAINGLATDADGNVKIITIDEFCKSRGCSREAYYKTTRLPNFWDIVNARRMVVSSESRLAKVHNTLYLKALKGEFQSMQLYLALFDRKNFRMPQQRVEVEMGGGLADLLNRARHRRREQDQDEPSEPIEGEVIPTPQELPEHAPTATDA